MPNPVEGLLEVYEDMVEVLLVLSRSGELRTQILKSHLVRTQSCNVLPLKPGVGQYIAIHATLPCLFLPFRSSHLHFFQNLSRFFSVLALASTGSCVGPQNKIGHLPEAGSCVECLRKINRLEKT